MNPSISQFPVPYNVGNFPLAIRTAYPRILSGRYAAGRGVLPLRQTCYRLSSFALIAGAFLLSYAEMDKESLRTHRANIRQKPVL